MTYDVTCGTCGAVYGFTPSESPVRKSDTVRCEFCGAKIHEWYYGRYFIVTVLEAPKKGDSEKLAEK